MGRTPSPVELSSRWRVAYPKSRNGAFHGLARPPRLSAYTLCEERSCETADSSNATRPSVWLRTSNQRSAGVTSHCVYKQMDVEARQPPTCHTSSSTTSLVASSTAEASQTFHPMAPATRAAAWSSTSKVQSGSGGALSRSSHAVSQTVGLTSPGWSDALRGDSGPSKKLLRQPSCVPSRYWRARRRSAPRAMSGKKSLDQVPSVGSEVIFES